ncbi:MAG: 16S rRNA (adenine(1518)-N(6)/adenine(1519)-N(6))-dimethyltransferase RsmA [Cytophagales bacterium]|nr:16S rRNA (adenine(1518)-N(6)/adenine(1519)-N(6))-dimethyltransferase RsmA [Cytophagales bacterium]
MRSVKPKKHLGQHFLRDESIAQSIVESLSPSQDDRVVLEVGPGTGVLSKGLIEKKMDFYAYDLDEESIDYLKVNYPLHMDRFRYQDFLRLDLSQFEKDVTIIGNFPYNISSQLFFQAYDQRILVKEVVCMIQKEVADRICSPHGNKVYGILSVLLQAFYEVEYLFTVPPHVFDPPPKVNSAVIRLKRNETAELDCDEKLFKRVVKEGFGKRRKTLRNALKGLNLPTSLTEDKTFDLRAEQLSVNDFVTLTKRIGTA